jgi:hypothetical protein
MARANAYAKERIMLNIVDIFSAPTGSLRGVRGVKSIHS